MEFTAYQYIIAILGGFLAGSINTLAGSGSAITLSILTEILGLPGNLANGTNRIGVIAQGSLSSYVFYNNGKLDFKKGKPIIISVTIGAIIGVLIATQISNEQFKTVFKYLMILMLAVILVKPKRWLTPDTAKTLPLWISIPVFLIIGFYGGFIQMGMGIFFLASLVLLSKFDIIEGNAMKSFTVFLYTFFVIAIFQYKGLINWYAGGIIAIGQMLGGYITARFATEYKHADLWAYRVLVLIVLLVILKMFGIISL